jgi:hypothetical protein
LIGNKINTLCEISKGVCARAASPSTQDQTPHNNPITEVFINAVTSHPNDTRVKAAFGICIPSMELPDLAGTIPEGHPVTHENAFILAAITILNKLGKTPNIRIYSSFQNFVETLISKLLPFENNNWHNVEDRRALQTLTAICRT